MNTEVSKNEQMKISNDDFYLEIAINNSFDSLMKKIADDLCSFPLLILSLKSNLQKVQKLGYDKLSDESKNNIKKIMISMFLRACKEFEPLTCTSRHYPAYLISYCKLMSMYRNIVPENDRVEMWNDSFDKYKNQ